jgi:hypothetical protein
MEPVAKVFKRTFEATQYPEGSEKQQMANLDPVRSEFEPSKKYVVLWYDIVETYRTKKEATARAEELNHWKGLPAVTDVLVKDNL